MNAPQTWVVILAGGVGSRFWPLSTPERPKQFLPLLSHQPMLRDTLDRLAPVASADRTLVLTNAELAMGVRAIAPELPSDHVLAEPRPAGTAAALAWAASRIAKAAGPDAIMVSVHADWAIADVAGFREALQLAASEAVRTHGLVTVGIVPTHADTGLGYIEVGEPTAGAARRVARFVEKPKQEKAEALVKAGALWNSGIFAWPVGVFLDELAALCPAVAGPLAAAGDDAEAFFRGVKDPIAVDVGVLERSSQVYVLSGSFGWNDVGTWSALRGVRAGDADGNVAHGRVQLRESSGNVVYAAGANIVLYGVSGLVVVEHDGVVLVTTEEKARNLKPLLETLPSELRERR
ncbi:MAG: mannose-1-phosphate guanylyltransferase [Gemmatimonadetes bacterium]|nr:mannose-1-phosphate guanylyltransferase [Gemmatimonadota bacterium]